MTDLEAQIEAAERAVSAARRLRSDAEARRRAEEDAARRVVIEKYAPEMATVQAGIEDARAALIALQDQRPAHEWEGRKVSRLEYAGYQSSKRLIGVVETRRTSTQFPANTGTYRIPEVGGVFVRLLKKDGTPSAKFDSFSGRDWKLRDDEKEAKQ